MTDQSTLTAKWLDRKYRASPERAGDTLCMMVSSEIVDDAESELAAMGYKVQVNMTHMYDFLYRPDKPDRTDYPVQIRIKREAE